MEEPLEFALSNNPKSINAGTINVDGSGERGFEFYASAYGDELYTYFPAVNIGTININGSGRHQLSVDCHFQNYGVINAAGSLNTDRWGSSEYLIDGYDAWFENYGKIDCGSGAGNAMRIYPLFINYEGAQIIEKADPKFASLVEEKNLAFYDHVVPANAIVTGNPS